MARRLPKGRKIVAPTPPPVQCDCGGYFLPPVRGKGAEVCTKCGKRNES